MIDWTKPIRDKATGEPCTLVQQDTDHPDALLQALVRFPDGREVWLTGDGEWQNGEESLAVENFEG